MRAALLCRPKLAYANRADAEAAAAAAPHPAANRLVVAGDDTAAAVPSTSAPPARGASVDDKPKTPTPTARPTSAPLRVSRLSAAPAPHAAPPTVAGSARAKGGDTFGGECFPAAAAAARDEAADGNEEALYGLHAAELAEQRSWDEVHVAAVLHNARARRARRRTRFVATRWLHLRIYVASASLRHRVPLRMGCDGVRHVHTHIYIYINIYIRAATAE